MKKNEISSGLSELFRETTAPAQKPTAQPSTESDSQEVAPVEEATPEEEEDLINSVDDPELKEKLRQKRLENNGRPKKGTQRESLTQGYTRACMVVNAEKYAKMRAISLLETLSIKEVMEAAMDLAIEAYEAKHGVIKVEGGRGDASTLFK